MSIREQRRYKDKQRRGIIDLTGLSNNNEAPLHPLQRQRQHTTNTNRPLKATVGGSDSKPIFLTIAENRGSVYPEPPKLIDPDGNFEEQLEAEGATIIDSTTYYPQSRTTISKRSQTPQEHAAENGYYLER